MDLWTINFFGLALSFVGTLSLIVGTPRDTTPMVEATTYAPGSEEDNAQKKKLASRAKFTGLGIILLAIGFFLQMVSQLLQMPS